ncbi:PLP-dependent aminotransferase family protein [uncultured Vibrio sp.]|uniref:MocR-like pyridoxine biosynthesis transcription factor PdxR n=1 Tax=uncultured Vibrio sp. TaxID=114054 RepID=UPI0025E331AB|nr:PLP-dependent aminotransferase family protein [uncultured Vibrio sp.]
MQPIDIGDLSFDRNASSLQKQLFSSIRAKITAHLWPKGGKLPSTRKCSTELAISRNTVIAVYEQLVSEGYLESKVGSGYYVAIELPESLFASHELVERSNQQQERVAVDINRSFAPGVPELSSFPMVKWSRLLQRHATRVNLLGNQDLQGDLGLRQALCDYLSSSRSVSCSVDQIIITSGAQQALSLAVMSTVGSQESLLMETPGYVQMRKIIELLGIKSEPVSVQPRLGLDLSQVMASQAKALYVTPSNQYPMGTTIDLEQRIELIRWAKEHERWIIEDDYDSEFQFAHRPFPSLQGLSVEVGAAASVLYVGSLSKVMFNGLRLGYLIVPKSLVARCLEIKDALSGDTPTHVQAALTDFIVEGDFLRHVRKMRRIYKQKHTAMVEAIARHFPDDIEVISQAAGLHVTLRWFGGVCESDFCNQAKKKDIILRPLSMYEAQPRDNRQWQGAVLGFGNIHIDEIDSKIAELAELL